MMHVMYNAALDVQKQTLLLKSKLSKK